MQKKRATCLAHPANAGIIRRLQELSAEAKARQDYGASRAYLAITRSLRKYPLPVASGQHALILEGVGARYSALFDGQLPPSEALEPDAVVKHKRKLLMAMTQFNATLNDSVDGEDDDRSTETSCPGKSLVGTRRLIPGTSAWSIVFCLYVCGSRLPDQAMPMVAITASVRVIAEYEKRCRIASFKKAADKLLEAGLISRRQHGDPDRGDAAVYALTPAGSEAGQAIVRSLDAPLLTIWNATCLTAPPPAASPDLSAQEDPVLPKVDCSGSGKKRKRSPLQLVEAPPKRRILIPAEQTTTPDPQRGGGELSLADRVRQRWQKLTVPDTITSFVCPTITDTESNDVGRVDGVPCPHSDCLTHVAGAGIHHTSCANGTSATTTPIFNETNHRSSKEHSHLHPTTSSAPAPARTEGAAATYADDADSSSFLLACLDLAESHDIPADRFSVVLLVDYRELSERRRDDKTAVTALDTLLSRTDVSYEKTNLPIGDFVWVCRFKKPHGALLSSAVRELFQKTGSLGSTTTTTTTDDAAIGYAADVDFVLEWVIERKTVADFAASVIDGR